LNSGSQIQAPNLNGRSLEQPRTRKRLEKDRIGSVRADDVDIPIAGMGQAAAVNRFWRF
jgi:hypothetical protein